MHNRTIIEFEECLSNNKTVKSVYKLRSDLEWIERNIGQPFHEWTIWHVCTAWNAVKEEYLKKFTPNGWLCKMKDFKSALDLVGLKVHKSWNKELMLYMNNQLKSEIDKAAEPYKKKSANKPPYQVWKKLIENCTPTMIHSKVKVLRAAQGKILLIWTLSSGARMDELLRLRKSDIFVTKKGQFNYISLTVRRGKASRSGKRPTYLQCFENLKEPSFCPILAFINYVEVLISQNLFNKDDCLLFPSSLDHPDDTISRKAIIDQWKKTATKLNLPKEHYPQAHSGHAQLVNTAWAFNQNDEQLLDITNWNSIRNLPEYVESPKEDSINIIKTTLTAEDLDAKCYMFTN